MTPDRIYIGEYANYFIKDGEVFTHDNNKLSKYAIPEKVINDGAAGHPYGYVIGESGTLYMLLGDNTTVTKVATGVKLVSAYWNWCVVVFSDNSIGIYKDGVKFSTLPFFSPSKIIQVRAAHYIIMLLEDGTVWQFDWSSTPWKSGAVWYKSASVLASMQPKQVSLPGKATWVTTSRLFFSAAIVNGLVYAWCDSFGARYLGTGFNTTPKVIQTEEKMKVVEASDHTLHMISEGGTLYGMGGLGVGFVGNGKKEAEVVATGGWPDMVVKTMVTTPVKISDRKFDWIAPGSSYKFRNAYRETEGTFNMHGYGKFGLINTGVRPADDSAAVGLISTAEPHRIDVPETVVPKTTAEVKAMIENKTYPGDYVPVPPPPTRKAIATLYDDGTWENIGPDE
jgi:hypothetical protein